LAKGILFRVIIAAVLTIVLLGISRRMSTRHSQEMSASFNGITATHTTVTESRIKQMPVITVKLTGNNTAEIGGALYYSSDNGPEQSIAMRHSDNNTLVGNLPPGGLGQRIRYRIDLLRGDMVKASISQDASKGFLIKYKGAVSSFVIIPHIILLFASIFCAFMALFFGFDILAGRNKVKQAAIAVLLTFFCGFIGGILIGIEVSHEVFGGNGWGGWPIGNDITDTKTEIFLLFWLVTMIFGWAGLVGKKLPISNKLFGVMVVVSFLVTLAAFLIPHSLEL
jgi:hypothetical protein